MEKSEWAIINWSRHQETTKLEAEINKREREENKESMIHGVDPLSIILNKTGNPISKDREYQNYWNVKWKWGENNRQKFREW